VKGAWLDGWRGSAAAVASLGAAGLAAWHVENAPDAAHDAGVARVLGLAAHPWGSLDGVVGGALAWLPLGTVAARAALGEAALVGIAAAVVYVLGARLLAACADAPRIGAAVALVAAWCALLGAPWQLEGSVVGGSATGALLALAPLAVLADANDDDAEPRWGLALFGLGLALSQDALAGLVAIASCAALVGLGPSARRKLLAAWDADGRALAACFLAGLLPLAVAVARTRAAGLPLLDAPFASGADERGLSGMGAPWLLLNRELGPVLVILAVFGAALPMFVARARPLAAGVLVLAVAGFACGWAGAALGPSRFGAPVLAALAATCLLAGVAMQALVRAISTARVPFAKASAAMVLVLELVAPVDSADEALRRCAQRARGTGVSPEAPTPAWDDVAFGSLPPRAIVLVTDAGLWRRASAARATGSLRDDVTIVPTFAHGRLAAPYLARDPAMVPLWRDLALSGAPSEEALSSLAADRPLLAAFEPAWGKGLGKHLVPQGLFDRFEPEPRGTSDRRKALEAFQPRRVRLARAVVGDLELADATAFLLRQRVLDFSASGDRDLIGGAVADLNAFAPGDMTGAQVVAHLVASKPGPGKSAVGDGGVSP
jgi:hypothetical protein